MVVWLWISIVIARWIGKKIPYPKARIAVILVLIPALFVSPLADEIIGKYQFDKLCKAAEEVKIYGTLPVGEELYTAEGKWRLGIRPLPLEEHNRADAAYRAVVRTESIGPKEVDAAIPIRMYEHYIYNKITGERLASYQQYGSSGGWISRNLEKPVLVRDQCFPPGWGIELTHRILPFQKSLGDKK